VWPEGQLLPTFPAPAATQDLFYLRSTTPDEMFLFSSLKGIVNRTQPRLFSYEGDAFAEGEYAWLTSLNVSYNQSNINNRWALLTKYKDEVEGLIVYDPAQPHTANLAIPLAKGRNLLIASPSLLSRLTAAPYSFPVVEDLRGKFTSQQEVYQHVFDSCWSAADKRLLIGLSPEHHQASLREYAVALGAVVVWLDPDKPAESALLNRFLASMPAGANYMGWWPAEQPGVARLSYYGFTTIASDYCTNLTFHSGMPRTINARPMPAKPQLRNKIYVAFTLSDGDNLQYVEHLMRKLWSNPDRGSVPIGWTISPAMVDAMPGALNYLHQSSTDNDNLISGPSGYGYTYPNYWLSSSSHTNANALADYVAKTEEYNVKAGLRVITIWNTITGEIYDTVGRIFANNAPTLLGLTAQNTGGQQSIYSAKLPGKPLSCNYCTGEEGMKNHIASASSGWDGSGPRFLIIQAQPWNDVRPTSFLNVANSLDKNIYEVVRPDHIFQLIREHNNLTINPGGAEADGNGLTGAYFNGENFNAQIAIRQGDSINFDWGGGAPMQGLDADRFSVRWTGQLTPRYSGSNTFYLTSDDGARLWIGNELIIDRWGENQGRTYTGVASLTAGQKYDFKLEYYEGYGNAQCKLEWASPFHSREVVPKSHLFRDSAMRVQTLTQKFYIDFGQDNPGEGRRKTDVDANGNAWNNVLAPSGSPSTLAAGATVTLKNAENVETPYVIEVARSICSNGGANGGLPAPEAALLGDLAVETATEDYFFLADGMGKGLFKLKNLDTAKAYKLYVYGCRASSGSSPRGAIYSLSGRNGSHGAQLNGGAGVGHNGFDGNNNSVWQSTPVAPTANGEISLEVGRLFSDQMAYISALKIEEYDGFTLPKAEKKIFVDFGKNNGGLDGLPTPSPDPNGNHWNNVYSNGDGWTIGASDGTDSLPLLASDGTPTDYALEVASEVRFNGVRNGALGGSDSPSEPSPALLGDLAVKTATYDYLFIESSSQQAVLRFKNLNPNRQYRFSIFGSRTDAGSEGRVGRIAVAGANAITGIHQMGGAGLGANGESYNNKNIFVSDPVSPDGERCITITMTCWLGYAHICCVMVEEVEISSMITATGIDISGGNAVAVCGGSLQLTATATPQNAFFPPIAWSVSDTTLARVTESGKLYAMGNGAVRVIAAATLNDESVIADTLTVTISNQSIGERSFTVMGSSVPWGQGAAPRDEKGYAWLWASYLQQSAVNTWTTNNISIGGNTTTDVTNRWDSDLLASCSRYVYYGLSLGNEGIHERGQVAFDSWRSNMLALIDRTRAHSKTPIVGNSYPRGDFNATDYRYVKQLNLLIHEWDAPSVNLLGAIDDGAGRWARGYMDDNAHPNTAGHAELFYAVVPSLLDALAAGKPQPVRDTTSFIRLEKTDKIRRIALTPENVLHPFTLTFSFRTTSTGTLASLLSPSALSEEPLPSALKIGSDGMLAYETATMLGKLTSQAPVNDGKWHQVSLTHYHAWGRTFLYVDGAPATGATMSERLAPVLIFLNDAADPLQAVDLRELFLHRSAMCAEEVQALHAGKMLKSSLEVYSPLSGGAAAAAEGEAPENRAQSLNAPTVVATDNATSAPAAANNMPTLRAYPNPAGDYLIAEGAALVEGAEVQVVNMHGAVVKRVPVKATGPQIIYLRELPAGAYIIRCGGRTARVVKR
jgi:lysophospholipase L1-like esterase